jgi:serine/threonine protein kinase
MNAFSQPAFSMDQPSGAGHALAPGTRLEYFEVGRVLSTSSFGIVYFATDLVLEQPVAIKEYLPTATATRSDGLNVVLRAAQHADAFQRGRRAFIHEARMLARCDNPALLRVLRLWEGNGTVYRVMPHYAGTSMLTWRQGLQDPPQEAWLRNFIDVLLRALDTLAQGGLVHRHVTPSNILIQPDDRPVLLDFDAVRNEMVSDKSQSLMSALDPSFAPGSQEALPPAPMQGLGPDLYSLAALIHFCISGHWPASAQFDSQWREPLADVVLRLQTTRPHLQYSATFLAAIDDLLDRRLQDRPRSTAEFRAALGTTATATTQPPSTGKVSSSKAAAPATALPPTMAPADVPTLTEQVSPPLSAHPASTPQSATAPGATTSPFGEAPPQPAYAWDDAPHAAVPPHRAPAAPPAPNPSASVLNLLASFDRRAVDRSPPAEPALNPVPPVLSDQLAMDGTPATDASTEPQAGASPAAPATAHVSFSAAPATAATPAAPSASPAAAPTMPPPAAAPMAAASAPAGNAFSSSVPPMMFSLSQEFSSEPQLTHEPLETGGADVPWESLSAYSSVSHARVQRASWLRRAAPMAGSLLVVLLIGAAAWKINDLHSADATLTELADVTSRAGTPATLAPAPYPTTSQAPASSPATGVAKVVVPEKEESDIAPADDQVATPRPNTPAGANPAAPGRANNSSVPNGKAPAVAPASTSVAESLANAKPARPPSTPREVCGTRTEFALFRCMQVQCGLAQWKRNSQCRAFLGSSGSED